MPLTTSVFYLDMSLTIGRKEGRKDRCQRRQGQKGGEKVEKETAETIKDHSIRLSDFLVLS